MVFILTSPTAIAPNGTPISAVVNALIKARNTSPVGVISNHEKPAWFDAVFGESRVQFLQEIARQDGDVIARNTKKFNLNPHDAIVLAGVSEDIMMAKNGGAVIVAAGWCGDEQVAGLGVKVDTPEEFLEVTRLTNAWSGSWWFAGASQSYKVRALADLSSMYVNDDQAAFARKLTETVKSGGVRLKALLTTTARSLQAEGISGTSSLIWGVYPSSGSLNDDTEVLSDFTHRLRTITSRVQMAKRGIPLFIRHKKAIKRSGGRCVDRNDPREQIETIHINPFYRGKIHGRNVIVIDDCVTYGLSFAVAASFLRKAGAASVTGVALGRFGRCLSYHPITILGDPFAPVKGSQGYQSQQRLQLNGSFDAAAQASLRELI